ncbi:LysM peptidoglycan-binding domain-containing protein [Streptomyces sp. NBC_01549]|uniref:LysM peptidoglycan-binding domain-containing protein n=1 Tax=unclassified Streptomyces TaxID=2593676 RepID=UPI00225650B3|nr:LysM peptidoglycan-binding domain-containing protein [Streptomyces sp. NBC_01549]MCX4596828.1 LysM peptidoglycan-binding domain-containing protein [Streptomyces sp. NBC_01549]
MAHRTPAPLRTVGILVRALLGLALLIALLAGTPYVLLLVGTQPTDLSGGIDVLLRPDDGTLFFTAITCIGWVAWAAFSLSVVLEIVAVTRRRSAPRLRGLGGLQSMASFLVGGIVLLAPTAASAATSAPAHAVTATQTAGDSSPSASSATPGSPDHTNVPTHTVTSSTELPWDLAEKYLGSGQRWQDIAALNPDIPGLAAGDQYLPKGAVITLPSDAVPATPAVSPASAQAGGARTQLNGSAPDADGERGATVTVQPGDYLSEIAQKELGDGAKWPKLFEASRGKPQPHGLPEITNPDVIYPGQQVTVPSAQAERHDKPAEGESSDTASSRPHTRPSTSAPRSGHKPGDDHTDTQAPAPGQSTSPAPQTSSPSTPSSRPTHQPGQEQGAGSAAPRPSASTSATASAEPPASDAPSPTATATQEPAASPASGTLQLRTVLGAGALLAAAVTGALALRRLLQRRRRKPGEKIAIASEISPAEAQLAAAAEPGGAARLDVALRTLAHQAAQDGDGELPQLRAARIGARTLEVLPEDLAHEPQAPFVSGQSGWWVLPADAPLLDEEAAREVPAPYPTLVTIGSTEAGDLLLLNLTQVPAVLLDGNPVHITEVCTSLALELGMSPWASDVEVVTIGFGEDLPQLLPTARIAHMRQATHALRDLSERLLEAHQMPETQHQPYLLLCASVLDADLAWEFADVIDKAGTVPVTLVAPASTAAAHFPEAEILNASHNEPQQLDYAGTEITIQRLEHAAYLEITTALKVSGQPPHPAEGPWQEVPDEPDSRHQPQRLAPERTTAPTTDAPTSPSRAADVSTEIFPALLAASTDPAGLCLLPTSEAPAEAEEDPAQEDPGTEATTGPTPAAPETDGGENSGEEGAAQEVEECEAHDLHAPEIRILGPVEVTGVDSTGHGPRIAQLAALLYFRPGRSADILCSDMDPVSPWSASTLNARLQGLRRSLGSDPAGNPYVPRRKSGEDPYRLSPGVRCDWTRFRQLVERALPLGPAGLTDLEKALTLVRGRPFGGKPLPWAEPYQQEMITRIIDVAHTVATYRTPAGPHHDLTAARQAVVTGLDVDDTAELLYRDYLRIESAAGNRQGLHTAITRVQQVNRALDCSLEIETEQLINDLLSTNDRQAPAQ